MDEDTRMSLRGGPAEAAIKSVFEFECLYLIIFQVLASYIRPFRKQSDSRGKEHSQSSTEGPYDLAVALLELLEESCLVPALSSYLRNDSGV